MPDKEETNEEAKERSAPTGRVVYEAIMEEGESELSRSSSALAYSGLAAGLSMGFSFLVPAYLHSHLPEGKWTPLITSFGYTIGFLLVILGRQQLFTENTLTVILPLFREFTMKTLGNVARLWVVVFLANLAGGLIFAFVLAKTHLVDKEVYDALTVVARKALGESFTVTLLRGIVAGWLVALLVWLLPFAETARVWVIIILTYIIGLGHLSHVIAGAIEAAFLSFTHQRSWLDFAFGFVVPALLGNIIGGVTLVAALNHAQVVSGGGGDDT
jgi:formate-nitrite transporter family protein